MSGLPGKSHGTLEEAKAHIEDTFANTARDRLAITREEHPGVSWDRLERELQTLLGHPPGPAKLPDPLAAPKVSWEPPTFTHGEPTTLSKGNKYWEIKADGQPAGHIFESAEYPGQFMGAQVSGPGVAAQKQMLGYHPSFESALAELKKLHAGGPPTSPGGIANVLQAFGLRTPSAPSVHVPKGQIEAWRQGIDPVHGDPELDRHGMKLSDFLREGNPLMARQLGLNLQRWHGIMANRPSYTEFSINPRDIGVHVGTPRAAAQRIGISMGEFPGRVLTEKTFPGQPYTKRVIPLVARAHNPIRMRDMGNWPASSVGEGLINSKKFTRDEVEAALKRGDQLHGEDSLTNTVRYPAFPGAIHSADRQAYRAEELRKLMESKGHDSIVYKNNVEDVGNDSHIILREHNLRVPWARFDPAQYYSKGLGLGIAGGALAPGLIYGHHMGSRREEQ
jgi:hypothetical protein